MMMASATATSASPVFETDTSLVFDLDGVALMNRELADLSELEVRKLFSDMNDGLERVLKRRDGKTALRILHPMFLMELSRREIPKAYTLNRLGVALRLTGNFERSIEALRWAISISNHLNNWLELARAFKEALRLPEALETIDQAIGLNATRSEYFTEKSIILAKLQRYDEARAVMAEARRLERVEWGLFYRT